MKSNRARRISDCVYLCRYLDAKTPPICGCWKVRKGECKIHVASKFFTKTTQNPNYRPLQRQPNEHILKGEQMSDAKATREDHVLVWNPKHKHGPAQMMVKIYALRHLPPSNRQQHCPPTVFARFSIAFQRHLRLYCILGFDEDKFVLSDRPNQPLLCPVLGGGGYRESRE